MLVTGCTSNQFRCESTGDCLANFRRCDSVRDCPNGEDERGCRECWYSMVVVYNFIFTKQNNNKHVQQSCCAKKVICFANKNVIEFLACNLPDFQCPDGSCIDSSRVCDGTFNCIGGEDEEGCSEYSKKQCQIKMLVKRLFNVTSNEKNDCW